jgi:hypothetical protein
VNVAACCFVIWLCFVHLNVVLLGVVTGFVPLEDDTDLRSMTAARVLVHVPPTATATNTTLAIEGRAFDDSDLKIAGKPLAVQGIPNSGAGTGHNTWVGFPNWTARCAVWYLSLVVAVSCVC